MREIGNRLTQPQACVLQGGNEVAEGRVVELTGQEHAEQLDSCSLNIQLWERAGLDLRNVDRQADRQVV
eukprot:13174564-Alexandrium_andersonii.AAC.1